MKKYIKINDSDNVLIALEDMAKDEIVTSGHVEIKLKEDVARGHKIAADTIKKGQNVVRYGFPIGRATQNIEPGAWVHGHNLETNLEGIGEYSYNRDLSGSVDYGDRNLKFKGYRREDGGVGIRNELWIIPTVGCVNGTADKIIEKFKRTADMDKIDAVVAFKHNYGCSQLGDDHANTRTILGNMVKHPNAGGVLVLGLGCENNFVAAFKESLGGFNEKRVRFLVAQEVGDEVEAGVRLLKELYENMLPDERVEVPVSALKIGLKCGGSDGLSGITANPLLGAFSDFLIGQGGSTVLTEVPEMFGAETILMNGCINGEPYQRF